MERCTKGKSELNKCGLFIGNSFQEKKKKKKSFARGSTAENPWIFCVVHNLAERIKVMYWKVDETSVAI